MKSNLHDVFLKNYMDKITVRSVNTVEKDMLHKELDLIQGCINRMAANSFTLKKWYIGLVFLGANVIDKSSIHTAIFMLMLILLTMILWGLDGFFLKMETFYRWKYEWVIKNRIHGNVLCYYDLNPYNKQMWIEPEKKSEQMALVNYVFSKTLIPFYVLGIIVPIVYALSKGLVCFFACCR